MQLFFDQFFNGVSVGVVYASVALALVIIYRTTGFLNFAQGEMALFSASFAWWLTTHGWNVWLALLATVVASFGMGAAIERLLIRPGERTRSPLNVVIVTLGLFLAINALASLIFLRPGTSPQMPAMFPSGDLGPVPYVTLGRAAVLAVECGFLWLLLQKTKVGLSLRGVASNAESSKLVGINPGNMLMLGWGLAAAIGAIAGTMTASGRTGFDSGMMQEVLVFAFAAAALGGFDSPLGAVVGGLIVGVVNSLTIQYVGFLQGIELVVPFGVTLLVLLFRPNGMFGRTIVERV